MVRQCSIQAIGGLRGDGERLRGLGDSRRRFSRLSRLLLKYRQKQFGLGSPFCVNRTVVENESGSAVGSVNGWCCIVFSMNESENGNESDIVCGSITCVLPRQSPSAVKDNQRTWKTTFADCGCGTFGAFGHGRGLDRGLCRGCCGRGCGRGCVYRPPP